MMGLYRPLLGKRRMALIFSLGPQRLLGRAREWAGDGMLQITFLIKQIRKLGSERAKT